MEKYDLYINGRWETPSSGAYFESDNPYDGEIWAKIARGNEKDVDFAVKAARSAFEDHWDL